MDYSIKELTRAALLWPKGEALWFKHNQDGNWICDISPASIAAGNSTAVGRPSGTPFYTQFYDNAVVEDKWPKKHEIDAYTHFRAEGSFASSAMASWVQMSKVPRFNEFGTGNEANVQCFVGTAYLTNLIIGLPYWDSTPQAARFKFDPAVANDIDGTRILTAITKLIMTLRPPGFKGRGKTPTRESDPWTARLVTMNRPIALIEQLTRNGVQDTDRWSGNQLTQNIILLHLFPAIWAKLTSRLSANTDTPEAAISGHLELIKFATVANHTVDVSNVNNAIIGIPQWDPYTNRPSWFPFNTRPIINQWYEARMQRRPEMKPTLDKVFEFLKEVQRVSILTLKYPYLFVPFMELGITSALKVSSMSELELIKTVKSSYFVQQAPPLGDLESALKEIYKGAVSITSRNQHAYVEIVQYLRGSGMKVIDGDFDTMNRQQALSRALKSLVTGSSSVEGDGIDDLVGIIDIYNVEEAYTVHSPSAYFCELLDALPRQARAQLFARRPDIQHLQLTAANTFVNLPYLDLAIETMESFLVYFQNTTTLSIDQAIKNYDTQEKDESKDLAAEPQNTLIDLYSLSGICSKPAAPFSASPLDLGIEETRRLLKALKVSRYELLSKFQDSGRYATDLSATSAEQEIVIRRECNATAVQRASDAETLQLSPADYAAITKESFLPLKYWEDIFDRLGVDGDKKHDDPAFEAFMENQTHAFSVESLWGYPSFDSLTMLRSDSQMPDPNEKPELKGLGYLVERFLPLTNLTVQEWFLVTKTRHLGPLFQPYYVDEDTNRLPTSPQYRIRFKDRVADKWHRVQGFLRLQAKSGLTIPELDLALAVLSGFDRIKNCITPKFIEQLAAVKRITDLTKGNTIDLLSFWGLLSPYEETGTLAVKDDYAYQRLFLTKRVQRVDPKFYDYAALGMRGESVFYVMDAYQLPIATALGATQVELAAIIKAGKKMQHKFKDEEIPGLKSDDSMHFVNMANVSILQRCITLMRVADLSAETLSDFLTVFPEVFDSPSKTFEVLSFWKTVSSKGLSIERLRFVLSDIEPEQLLVGISDIELLEATTSLSAALLQSEADFISADIGQANNLQQTLSLASSVFKRDELKRIESYLLGLVSDEQATPIIDMIQNNMLDIYGRTALLDPSLRDLLELNLADLEVSTRPPVLAKRIDQVHDWLASSIRASKQELAVKSAIVHATKTSNGDLASYVFKSFVQAQLPGDSFSSSGDQALLSTFGKVQRDALQSWSGYFLPQSQGDLFFATSDTRIIDALDSGKVNISVNGVVYEWLFVKKDLYITTGCTIAKDRVLEVILPAGDIRYKSGSSAFGSIPPSTLVSKSSFAIIKDLISQLLQHTTLFTALNIAQLEVEAVFPSWRNNKQSKHFDKTWVDTLCKYTKIRDSVQGASATSKNAVLNLIAWIKESNRWKDTPKEKIPDSLKEEADRWSRSRTSLSLLAESIATTLGCPNLNLESVLSVACQSRDPDDILEKLLYDSSCVFRLFDMVPVLVKFGLSGTSARDVFTWAAPGGYYYKTAGKDSLETAAAIKRQMRTAIADDDEWNKTITPISDELRVLRRDALIYALLRSPQIVESGVRDANGLFDYFWVDTQMSPVMKTSRIKQATSVVQTFTQRCLLGLEKDPATNRSYIIDQNQWQWLQKYRVWEANRRVYLTPETWLSMSTLDLKSEIFVAFENNLSQGVIDWDLASNSVSQYVMSLCDISDLYYITQHMESHGNDQFTLHIFARTNSSPALFYYRTRHSQQGWTPWKKMDIDIMTYESNGKSGQYLMPYSRNGRLFLFLPEFKVKMKAAKPVDLSAARNEATKTVPESPIGIDAVEITLAWSEYRNGVWSKKSTFGTSYLDSWTNHAPQSPWEFARIGLVFVNVSIATSRFNFPLADGSSLLHAYQFNFVQEENGVLTMKVIRPTAKWDIDAITSNISGVTKPEEFKQNLVKQINVPPKWYKPCEFRITLSQLYCDVPSTPNYWLDGAATANIDTIFGESLKDGIQWAPDRSIVGIPQLINGVVRSDRPSTPYTSTLRLRMTQEPLYNDEAHLLMETVTVGTPMRSAEILSSNASDFGMQSRDGQQYNLKATAYGLYGWELGFFIPMLLAERFLASRRFDLALKAISLVFDPLTHPQGGKAPSEENSSDERQWRFKPFQQLYDPQTSANSIIHGLGDEGARPSVDEDIGPFNPHSVCRGRILSYMKWTVLRFVEILTEWGDAKFREDTLETLPEAILMYTQASNIIGPRLQLFDRPAQRQPTTYQDLSLNGFITEFESMFPWDPSSGGDDVKKPWLAGRTMSTELFAIPAENKLMDLRDLVDDRLFKIRNSMDIKGMVRTLAFYEPRIDPGKLIRAAAGQSFNLANTLNDMNVPLVNVRFNRLVSKALEICFDLRQFGRTYMEIIKNKDDQALATLLASQDTSLNKMRQEIAQMGVASATSTMKSMNTSRETVENKMKHIFGLCGLKDKEPPKFGETFTLIDNDPPKMIGDDGPHTVEEQGWLTLQSESAVFKGIGMVMKLASAYYSLIPETTVNAQFMGIGPSGTVPELKDFGSFLGDSFAAAGDIAGTVGEIVAKTGEWRERLRERKVELNELGSQLMQLDQEMETQEVLTAMAQKEVEKLERELEWNTFIADWQRATRTTNDGFYTWLQSEFNAIYYQTYNFAYDMAKKAEQALFMELGLPTMDSIIEYGCWDANRNGLLAGEKLYNGLRKLEQAFSETRAYDFEITKKVSIKDLDQSAYTNFTRTMPHVLEFRLPEELFDLDFPGHYKRRIRTVSIGFAADGREISAELTLLSHKYRVTAKDTDANQYPEKKNSDIQPDLRFRQDGIPINAIGVTVGTKSTVAYINNVPAESANGLFELNFGGDSYLPFEGAGVISKWRLELSPFTEIDPIAISDMVMTIQYTSSRGSDQFKKAVTEYIRKYIPTVPQLRPAVGWNRTVRLPAGP